MSEKDRSQGSLEDIEEQIRKLEREKEELERINERKRLEQRLQLLQGNVTQLKSGSSSKDNQSSGKNQASRGRDSGDLNTSLEESQARLRSLQQSVLNSSLGGASSLADDSQEDHNRSSDDADQLDDVMSATHKQALRIHRDVLVENMTPDDIFNDLISKHILTNSDVSRIKEKNTTEAINEELLNVLIRRSEKAFYVFVSSLRRTLQGWLANRLDPISQPTNKRRRRTGEMNVNIDCERVVPARSKRSTCTCQEVEEQILLMAKGAFAHIRRRDASPAAFEQFRKEIQQTNIVIKESMEIRNTLKELCRHGDLVDLSEGSVCFTLRCTSLTSCQELWDRYISGCLLGIFQKHLVNPFLLKTCGAQEIHLCLRISRIEFLTCAIELANLERDRLLHDENFNKGTPIKKRLRQQRSQVREMRQPFTELSLKEMQNRSILSSSMTPDQTIRLQDTMGSCAYQISSCLEESPQQRFAYESVKASATFKKGMTQERKSTIVLKNSSSRKEALQATYKKHLYSNLLRDSSVRKQKSIVSCPYNLRYRLLNS